MNINVNVNVVVIIVEDEKYKASKINNLYKMLWRRGYAAKNIHHVTTANLIMNIIETHDEDTFFCILNEVSGNILFLQGPEVLCQLLKVKDSQNVICNEDHNIILGTSLAIKNCLQHGNNIRYSSNQSLIGEIYGGKEYPFHEVSTLWKINESQLENIKTGEKPVIMHLKNQIGDDVLKYLLDTLFPQVTFTDKMIIQGTPVYLAKIVLLCLLIFLLCTFFTLFVFNLRKNRKTSNVLIKDSGSPF